MWVVWSGMNALCSLFLAFGSFWLHKDVYASVLSYLLYRPKHPNLPLVNVAVWYIGIKHR